MGEKHAKEKEESYSRYLLNKSMLKVILYVIVKLNENQDNVCLGLSGVSRTVGNDKIAQLKYELTTGPKLGFFKIIISN